MSGQWFLPHAPCTDVYAVLGMLYRSIASVYVSSGNARTEFYVPSRFLLCFKCEIFIKGSLHGMGNEHGSLPTLGF